MALASQFSNLAQIFGVDGLTRARIEIIDVTVLDILSPQKLWRISDILSLPGYKVIPVDRKRESILIDRAQRGDSQAFAELYNACVDKIYRYIYYRVERVSLAED